MPSRNTRVVRSETGVPQIFRTCSRCRVELLQTRDNFAYSEARDRWNAWCKPCSNEYSRSRNAGGNRSARRQAARTGRRFGLEIEFIGDREAVTQALRAEGLEAQHESYNHTTRRHWKVTTDASVNGGGELVSPPLRGDDGTEQVRAACRALQAAGARVTRATGLHVHHEVRDLTVENFRQLVRNWHNCQSATDGLVAASRRGNSYCQPLSSYDLRAVETLSTMERSIARRELSGDRYRTLNLQSYGLYGTVEARQHQGTINANKILAWVSFGQAMIAAAVAGVSMSYSVGETADMLRSLNENGHLAEEPRNFLVARAGQLSRGPAPATAARASDSPASAPLSCGTVDCSDAECVEARRVELARLEEAHERGAVCDVNETSCDHPDCRRLAELRAAQQYRQQYEYAQLAARPAPNFRYYEPVAAPVVLDREQVPRYGPAPDYRLVTRERVLESEGF